MEENIKMDIFSLKKEKIHNYNKIFNDKIIDLQNIIRKTLLSSQKYKSLNIINSTELNACGKMLLSLYSTLDIMHTNIKNDENINNEEYIQKLQDVINDLSSVFRLYGTEKMDDLLKICFGVDYTIKNNFVINENKDKDKNNEDMENNDIEKYNLLNMYSHPFSYKIMPWKNNQRCENKEETVLIKNKLVENFMIVESSKNLDCFDLSRTSKVFEIKVHGIKISIHNNETKKTMIINSIVDDIMLECIDNPLIKHRLKTLRENKPKECEFVNESFERFVLSLTLKDLFVYNNQELYNKFIGYMTQTEFIKQKTISNITRDFITSDLFLQRNMIIQLLIKSSDLEYQYIAYLLYDLLSSDTNGVIDTTEQSKLYDSFSWNIKKFFRDTMKHTIDYTNSLSKLETSKIPLEQQICLMKVSDNVKEKAIVKLKEVKSKSDDSGSKARQYLEGLLKIPFGIYKNEEILNVMKENISLFSNLIKDFKESSLQGLVVPFTKEKYTSIEMLNYTSLLKKSYKEYILNNTTKNIKYLISKIKRLQIIDVVCYTNELIQKNSIQYSKLHHSGKKVEYMREIINGFIDHIIKTTNETNIIIHLELLIKLYNYTSEKILTNNIGKELINIDYINNIDKSIKTINEKNNYINTYMKNLSKTLDDSVYGHKRAKKQIERIIGQWINGENIGYCFGFEGPAGVGKTSLAKKGISKCLKDVNGETRPFSFIAIGGTSNGSSLEGHNYTYLGSTWGRIVDILIETKCMNPIIFIDELDKVSNTEHGKEIIGILTHVIDQTQNSAFQDKYFNGIDIDLSKVLFIFSYNDVNLIDKILLDRIHRIKFDNLTLEDKLVISKNYMLPEIYKNMGLTNMIQIDDDILEHIIEHYTNEPGVRKLKQILFDIVGEINLEYLKKTEYDENQKFPIKITLADLKEKYLKDRQSLRLKKISEISKVGVINGLWANSQGKGGVLSIESVYFPSSTFLELKLTGMQGDVMKESMSISKTLACSLLEKNKMEEIKNMCSENNNKGIHIHVPEGATPKDGPSAGTAITIVLYSLFTNKKIRYDVAITGEICLQGNVTAIGGLELKILGGIKAGVKKFLFPKENENEYNEFIEKYKNKEFLKDIEFVQIENIHDAIKHSIIDE